MKHRNATVETHVLPRLGHGSRGPRGPREWCTRLGRLGGGAGLLLCLLAACSDTTEPGTPSTTDQLAAGGGASGAAGAEAGGEAGGAAGGAESCASDCPFFAREFALDLSRGCKTRVRDEPELVLCPTGEGACGGIDIGCWLAFEADGYLQLQSFPGCPILAPAGWREPTDAELTLWQTAPLCP